VISWHECGGFILANFEQAEKLARQSIETRPPSPTQARNQPGPVFFFAEGEKLDETEACSSQRAAELQAGTAAGQPIASKSFVAIPAVAMVKAALREAFQLEALTKAYRRFRNSRSQTIRAGDRPAAGRGL